MAELKVRKVDRIDAEITVPGDKSISHRAVMFAALANGPCVLRGFLPSADCLATVEAMRNLGVEIEMLNRTTLRVHGRKGEFTAPTREIDCGNSGTTMRLLSGLLASQPFTTRLVGDASLSRRPMRRVIEPLSQMGALVVEGGELRPIQYISPVASAQVKSAILLAGLRTRGRTTVVEPAQSRDHTERMLEYFLVHTNTERPSAVPGQGRAKGPVEVSIHGPQVLESRDFVIPGDISSAAFWLTAAGANPRSRVLVRNIGLNETRTGILGVLVRMGAHVQEHVHQVDGGERFGSVRINGARLKGVVIEGDEIPNVIDEIPILAVAGALAEGVTVIRDAKELRVKETDRIAAIAENLGLMGVEVRVFDDGMEIVGGAKLRGTRLRSFGDHRIAMAFAVAGMFASKETVIEEADCVETSYPGFADHLRLIQASGRDRIRVEALEEESYPVEEGE